MSQRSMARGAMAVVLAIASIVGVAGSVSAAPKPAAHCISPIGTDLNVRWGVSETIVAPWCTEIEAGRSWRVSQAWFMNTSFDAMPDDFVAEGSTPLEDFLAKVIGVKIVVDAGTSHERTVVFTNVGDLGTLADAGGFAVAQALTLGTVRPLNVGAHTIDAYFSMRALHCDGLGAIIEENCLPAGDTPFEHFVVTVGSRSGPS
ncbi:MAG: hypothetical protein LH650_10640 [Chloroflexi bacterium]|nr:hypothetical protein [Chloroflexota bacterium]